jgi:hypothetical protein
MTPLLWLFRITNQTPNMELKIRPTPLTDSLIRHEKIGFNFDAFDMIEHARKMERERTYLMDKVQELEKDKAWLIEKGEKLVRWVESPRHTHEEVRDHNGRLKDTGIWCQFYVAVRGIQRKDSDVPISGHNAGAVAPPPQRPASSKDVPGG